ncbi:uracil phosphoribosyltransferase [Aquifex sp.]
MIYEVLHPIVQHKVNLLRDTSLPKEKLRSTLDELSTLLVYESLHDLRLELKRINTWIGEKIFPFIREEEVIFVPILRAGMGMLSGALKVIPNAEVGFIAAKRNEKTLKARIYYKRLPDLKEKVVVILDPMLATGGTLEAVLREIKSKKPKAIKSVHVIASPEGSLKINRKFKDVELFIGKIDEKLDKKGYIIPGLGDMGDRLYSEGVD